jgi:hypothetical protein
VLAANDAIMKLLRGLGDVHLTGRDRGAASC